MVDWTGGEAGVVEEEEVDGAIGVGAVVGGARAGDAVGGTGLAVVGVGGVDVLSVGTGGVTGVAPDVFVVLGGGDISAALAAGESRSSAGETARSASITVMCCSIPPEAGRTIKQALIIA